jgi:predicted anti-sigma-YlaC factor YlaD
VLEQLPEWAQFLFEPFDRFALDTVGVWYIATMVVILVLGAIGKRLGLEAENPLEGYTLTEKLLLAAVGSPIAEEIIFRIFPMWLGVGATGIIALSVLWALLHGKRWLLIMITVPLYVKMALAGMFIELILVHAFHNTWAVLLSHFMPDRWKPDTGETDDQQDLSEIEDDEKLLDEIADRLENDDDFDPEVTVNGTTYDSFADVPIREVRKLLEDSDDD